MQYTYEELIEDLEMGGEIEFTFKNIKYYIGSGTGRNMFWEFYNSASEIAERIVENYYQK